MSLFANSPERPDVAEADAGNDDWETFRGLAGRPDEPREKRKRLLRIAAAAVLAMAVVVGLFIVVLKFRDRIPSLASSARAEVAALASTFRLGTPIKREANLEAIFGKYKLVDGHGIVLCRACGAAGIVVQNVLQLCPR